MAAEAEIIDVPAPKKGRGKFIVIGVALAVVLLGGAAGIYYFMNRGASAPMEEAQVLEAPASFIFNLPTMTVNLNNDEGGEAFMRLSVALEVADEETMRKIQPQMAKVVDAFQVYLRELRKSDLEGSAGIYRLKEELTRRVNVAIAPARVESILFKEILVQ